MVLVMKTSRLMPTSTPNANDVRPSPVMPVANEIAATLQA